MSKKERIARIISGGALMVWLWLGYDFANPWLWAAAFLTLVPALARE